MDYIRKAGEKVCKTSTDVLIKYKNNVNDFFLLNIQLHNRLSSSENQCLN